MTAGIRIIFFGAIALVYSTVPVCSQAPDEILKAAIERVRTGQGGVDDLIAITREDPKLLLPYLNDENPDVALLSTWALRLITTNRGRVGIDDPEIIDRVVDVIVQRFDSASGEAAQLLRYADPSLIDERQRTDLLNRVERSPGYYNLQALGRFPPNNREEALLILRKVYEASTGDPKRYILTRRGAERALARLGDSTTRSRLRETLKSEKREARIYALIAIAYTEDRTFIPDIMPLLDEPDAFITKHDRGLLHLGIGSFSVGALEYMINSPLGNVDQIGRVGVGPADKEKWQRWWQDQLISASDGLPETTSDKTATPEEFATPLPTVAEPRAPASSTSAEGAETPQAKSESNPPIIFLAIIAALILAGAVFFLRRISP